MPSNLTNQLDTLRKANRKSITTAVMASIIAHVVIGVVAGIWIVASYIQSDPPQFVSPPPPAIKIPPQTKQHRMNLAAHAGLTAKPTFKARLVSLRPTEFALPEAPMVSMDNMLVPDPSTIANSMVTGLAGSAGAGAGAGVGLTGAGGQGLGTGIDFMGIRANGQRILLLFDVSGSVVNKANASNMPLARIKDETMKLIDGLPANARFGMIQFVRNHKIFQAELVPATVPNRELARTWIDKEWSETGTMPRTGRGVTHGPDGFLSVLGRAFEMKPDLIFVISDGAFWRSGPSNEKIPTEEFDAFFREIGRSGQGRVPIHFIGFQMRPDDKRFWERTVRRQGGSLKEIN